MENKENKFDEKFEKLKVNFEISLKAIEQNIAEKLYKKSQIEQFNGDLKKIKIYIEDTEKYLKELQDIMKMK